MLPDLILDKKYFVKSVELITILPELVVPVPPDATIEEVITVGSVAYV
jgi:hypothetical protein